MTNQIAIVMVLVFAAIFLGDAILLDGRLPVFLAREFIALVEYLSFWR